MLNRLGRILPTIILTAATIGLGSGCRTDDAPASPPQTSASETTSPEPWAKPVVRVARPDARADLIVRLYEVRHGALGAGRVPQGAKSVIQSAADGGQNLMCSVLVRKCRQDDPLLSAFDGWCAAPNRPAVLLKSLQVPHGGKPVEFVWENVWTHQKPSVGELSLYAMRLDDGRVQLQIGEKRAYRRRKADGMQVPGLIMGEVDDSIELAADETAVIGGLTFNEFIDSSPKWFSDEKSREETVELVAVVSVAPLPAAARDPKAPAAPAGPPSNQP